jgi:hypothetical protein
MHHNGQSDADQRKENVVLKTVPTGAEYRHKGKHHQRQKQHPQNGVALKKAFEECAHGWVAWSE